MHQYTNTPIHQHTNTPIHQHTTTSPRYPLTHHPPLRYYAAADHAAILSLGRAADGQPSPSSAEAVAPAARELAEAQLDVLVFCDIGMEPFTYVD